MGTNHDGEDSLLHLTGVLGSEDDHLLVGKVDSHAGSTCHASGVSVRWERTSVIDDVVGVEARQFFSLRSDEHVAHEQGMVSTGADDANVNSVFLVPTGIAIDDVDAIPRVQVINGSLTIDLPNLSLMDESAKKGPCQDGATMVT